MAYEVTRVHLEMSVEDYDAFREWQTEKETTESETELKYLELAELVNDITNDITRAADCFIPVHDREKCIGNAYNRLNKYYKTNKTNGGL